jgi:hypothetical protein
VERGELSAKLDRLLALRGDPLKGLPVAAWADNLQGVEQNVLMRAVLEAVRALALPEWEGRRPEDRRPQRACDAAEAWLQNPTEDAVKVAKEAAKECTAARNETFGDIHHTPEAARCVARLAGADNPAQAFEALSSLEEGRLQQIALTSEYHRIPEVRRSIVGVLRRTLLPPEKPAGEAPPLSVVPYSLDAKFELGQRIAHPKFGEVPVVGLGDKWVEVQLADGTKKRLAQRR